MSFKPHKNSLKWHYYYPYQIDEKLKNGAANKFVKVFQLVNVQTGCQLQVYLTMKATLVITGL